MAHKKSRVEHLRDILGRGATTAWLRSENAVKRRIATLEVVWRDAVEFLAQDIQAMFGNFEVIADAYDIVDINTAVLKQALIEKGVITEEEFQAKAGELRKVLHRVREKKARELEELRKKAEEEVEEVADPDQPDQPDRDLVRMKKAAEEAGRAGGFPSSATIFGGG